MFIPGNAGNYKQVRSFITVTDRVFNWEREMGNNVARIDLFAIETKDELSAFDPSALNNQAIYINEALEFILRQYKAASIPTLPQQVVLVGHSMGGIVSRKIVTLPRYNNTISTIFTLSTPHNEPPVPITYALQKFYQDLNLFWSNSELIIEKNITLVSVAAGTRDSLVDSSLTNVDKIMDRRISLSAYATGIPGTWASSDHEGMVW